MKFSQCPLCESSMIQQKNGIYNFEIKGRIVPSPIIEYWECPSCGEVFFDQEANKKIDEEFMLVKSNKNKKSCTLNLT